MKRLGSGSRVQRLVSCRTHRATVLARPGTSPLSGSRVCLPTSASAAHRGQASKASKKATAGVNVEDVYEKKTPAEHVLLRPGMYIGSVEDIEQPMWLLRRGDSAAGSDAGRLQFETRSAKYNPGLYKLFDEILVNAIDNHARDKTTTRIDVTLPEAGSASPAFSVRNNGRGIPVQFHAGEKVYVPEMVLGQLLTGSNFADAKVCVRGCACAYVCFVCACMRCVRVCVHARVRACVRECNVYCASSSRAFSCSVRRVATCAHSFAFCVCAHSYCSSCRRVPRRSTRAGGTGTARSSPTSSRSGSRSRPSTRHRACATRRCGRTT
jgi:hypothetical protein